ncbi:hypothetical protein [Chloroflexus sp.]|uniref:hypothetical protein n=1 Tax=Chloroflexus sp. TaxID=1904827 RepID=UPI002ACE7705|nr:hypothetical protein [Chloroflexus sp.]
MWLIAEFEAVTLFSLRPSFTTSSGGATLLAPTPFAIKMAVLDALCRTQSLGVAQTHWPTIRQLEVGLRPAAHAVVSHVFQRVLRPSRSEAKPDDPKFEGFFQRTIGYREYVHFAGSFGIALGWEGQQRHDWLRDALINITYLGKRGGFVQLLSAPEYREFLPPEFVSLTKPATNFPIDGTLQMLDDCGDKLSFDKVNVYDQKAKLAEADRPMRRVVLPYRLKRSSKSFSWYERV